jgi:ABC-type Co2+ transport system permease subunit
MDFPTIPGLDKGALLASFCGAVAYLATRDKMPPLRAVGSVVAGGIAAAYIGPWAADVAAENYKWMSGERARYALIFVTGVGGIWLLNLIVRILEECTKQAGDFVAGMIARLTGRTAPKPPPVPPVPQDGEQREAS